MHDQGLIPTILPLHILGGALALVFGYTALYAGKGGATHRKSGMGFVYAMVVMSLSGALIATLNGSPVSVVAGLITFYFVVTALCAVRSRPEASPWIERSAMVYALVLSAAAFGTGVAMIGSRRPETAPIFMFGIVGLLAAAGDLRVVRAGTIAGARRITRHLWRMCFAMWVAAASFFWGPQGRVPEMIRVPALQAAAVLLPIAAMLYWLWRIRARRTLLTPVKVAS